MSSCFTNPKPAIVMVLCLMLAACWEEKKPQGTAEHILKSTKGGDFRGINIGDRPEDVKRTEDAETVYSMPDELVYRIPPNDKDSTWYEISYNFNQQGLYNIDLEIYPAADSGMSSLREDFITHYKLKYGECQVYNGYCQWRTMTEGGHIVSITLSDTLANAARPCLKVNFNESQSQ
ncbi:MAG: hypothetical protein ACKVOR_13635 [Flavobacteriales bacterium]